MKALRPVLALLFLFLFVSNNSTAQKASYTTPGGWTLGLGAGYAFQKSDLFNSRGLGFDFVVGSQLYRKENAFLSVDWKFRFLAGENKAYDHRINPDNTYSNIRYSFFNYDLELGLTLNRLRERTGIILTGFAGIGITHGRTFIDLYDAGNNLYDYGGIDPMRDKTSVYNDLVALSDGDFETHLVNKVALLPTAGLYLGYQLSRSFAIGVEFKTNICLTEENSVVGIDIDNGVISGSGIDRNNYVSLGLRWSLRGGRSHRGSTNNYSAGVTSTYAGTTQTGNQIVTVSSPHPVVNITQPSAESIHTGSSIQTVKASIQNVSGPDNISFIQNGFPNNSFTYNANTQTFIGNVTLRQGENSIRIKATNQISTAEDLVIITLDNPMAIVSPAAMVELTPPAGNQEEIDLPMVRFIQPATPLEVTNNIFRLSAETQNVHRRNDVTLRVNGADIHNFAFGNKGIVSVSLFLAEGVNTMEITARNEAGSASESTFITYYKPVYVGPVYQQPVYQEPVAQQPVYRPPVTQQPVTQQPVATPCRMPVLRSIEPIQDQSSTDQQSYTIRAEVRNAHGNQLRLTSNGKPITFNLNNSLLSSSVPLVSGLNTIILSASNECGEDKISARINYVPPVVIAPCASPQVKFTLQHVQRNDATHELRGSVSNVNNKAEISLTLDGKAFNGFQFSPATGDLNAIFKLTPGSHTVSVKVSNACGTDAKSESVSLEEEEEEEEEEETCGIRINPGNSDWQFCMVTPSGTFTRQHLSNSNFSYSGTASSLYILPIAGGGNATVNGKAYPLRSGQYYLFTGGLNVKLSSKNPGSMGHWSVCITASRPPQSGNGNNRPKSPCESQDDEKSKAKDNDKSNGQDNDKPKAKDNPQPKAKDDDKPKANENVQSKPNNDVKPRVRESESSNRKANDNSKRTVTRR